MRALHRGAAVLLAAGLLASGCSADPAEDHDQEHGANDTHVTYEPAPASPTWDNQAAADAAGVAFEAMTAYIDNDEGWFDRLRPMLTPESQPLYRYTDPTEPWPSRLAVKSSAQLRAVERGTPFLAQVDVGTDIGTYTVWLARDGGGLPWRVERFILPPEGGQ